MRRVILALALLLLATHAQADVEVYYNDVNGVKGTVVFEPNGTMSARFDTEWALVYRKPAPGNLVVIAYWQDGVTPTRDVLCGFVVLYGTDPACPRPFMSTHLSKTSTDPRMIWTYDGPGTYPARAVGLIAYPSFYPNPHDYSDVEYLHIVMTCATDRGRTTCVTPLPPDPEPMIPTPTPTPTPTPVWTGGGIISNESFYGCGTFGC